MNIIEKSGTWYTYKDERVGQGRENARNYLKERPEMMKTVREEVLKKAGIGKAKPEAPTAAKPALGATAAGQPMTVTKATAPAVSKTK